MNLSVAVFILGSSKFVQAIPWKDSILKQRYPDIGVVAIESEYKPVNIYILFYSELPDFYRTNLKDWKS